MKIEDNRQAIKRIKFKDLEVGSIFEHVALDMIMIKLDEVISWLGADYDETKNALRIDNTDPALVELWHISPESWVIPVKAKLVIEE